MRWSDIIIDKQDQGQISNNVAMMGIAYEDDIELLQTMDKEQNRSGDAGFAGQAPNTGKSNGDPVSTDSFSSNG